MLSLVDNYLNLDDEVRSFWILIPNTRELKSNTKKRPLPLHFDDVSKRLFLPLQDFLGAEEAARLSPESPDEEFEGMGDYEESIYSDWKQPKGKGDAGQSEA